MKKVLKASLVVLILCTLVLTLAGCGDTSKNGGNNVNFSRGEWVDNQYQNDFAKIKFNLPEGWEKATDEQIAQVMGTGEELLNADQQKWAELAEKTSVYGMTASDPSTGASVMVTLEKPVLKVTPERYIESVKQQLEALDSMQYSVGDPYTKEIASESYTAADAELVGYNGMKQHYYVKAVGDYIVGIIVTTTEDSQLDTILNSFE